MLVADRDLLQELAVVEPSGDDVVVVVYGTAGDVQTPGVTHVARERLHDVLRLVARTVMDGSIFIIFDHL